MCVYFLLHLPHTAVQHYMSVCVCFAVPVILTVWLPSSAEAAPLAPPAAPSPLGAAPHTQCAGVDVLGVV